ncbi:MAG: hypothetical protein U1E50_08775 [Caulobacteraceae bacterium]
MPAETDTGPNPFSVWDTWAAGAQVAGFASARAALAALLAARNIKRVWLPAFACAALAEAATGLDVRLYGIRRDLTPVLADLGSVRAGDAVVAVNYFGRAPGGLFRDQARLRPDVLWIDDRAQALAPEAGRWAEVTLYSPRKLFGVGDGGLLVADTPLPSPQSPSAGDPWAPEKARAKDPAGDHPQTWYPLFQARETAFSTASVGISPATVAALKAIDPAPSMKIRKANWRILARRLAAFALILEKQVSFAPLFFPIAVRDPSAVVSALAALRIYCPRHWAELPAGASGDAVWLSEHQISLPLDQRYDEADMERIADAVEAHAR